MRDLGAFGRQRLVMVFERGFGVERELELVVPGDGEAGV
jgi:hypothetical protein